MTDLLPKGYRSDRVQCGDVSLHVVHNGPAFDGTPLKDDRQPILLLHGFPEFWIAWEATMERLGQEYLVLVPDQRGYNLSDAPQGAEHYKTRLLVGDMIALADSLLGERCFTLAGHDWGASVSYALAINFPNRINKLIIANGVHPVCFQRALIDYPAQAQASSYFEVLQRDDAGQRMAENDFRRTFGMFERFSGSPWLTEALKASYRKAWAGPERMAAMANWYHSSPIVVPREGERVPTPPLYDVAQGEMRIAMPHLLIWGSGDQALLPQCHEPLDAFCDDLRKVEIPEADHWILHTHGREVAELISEFIN